MPAEAGSRLADVITVVVLKRGESYNFISSQVPLAVVWVLPGGYLYLTHRGQNNS